jgi:ankyrin repeat protein
MIMKINKTLLFLTIFQILFICGCTNLKEKTDQFTFEYNRTKAGMLLNAVESNQVGLAKAIILTGVNINELGNGRYTALTYAARTGNLEMVKMLLDAGADINGFNAYGRTALTEAAITNHTDIVHLLLNRGADINAKYHNGYTGLMEVSFSGNIEMVKFFINCGADVKAKTIGSTWSVLTGPVINGHADIVDLLINLGTDINIKDFRGKSLITLAKENHYYNTVSILKKAGAPE